MYAGGTPSETTVATSEPNVIMCVDVGLRNTADGSDGPGRNGRWRMNDGVVKPQTVSGIQQQLGGDCDGSPMRTLPLDIVA